MISVLALLISVICFYFVLKKKHTPDQELEEFKSNAEILMTEFNRITARNVGLLDDKIEELDQKIRTAQKMDLLIKERLEELNKLDYFKRVESSDPVVKKDSSKKKVSTKKKKDKTELELYSSLIEEEIEETRIIEEIDEEMISYEEIASQAKDLYKEESLEIETKEELKSLHEYLDEGKNKEELIELGFSPQEIGLAQLSREIK